MGIAFYRKYRSKSLAEVVGQEHITDTLARALQNSATSHAYLFTGPRGVGKTSVARILAHEINQLPYNEVSQHLDIIEIDAASNRRIDDIRDLRDKVSIAPTTAKYKVYIIDEVHMLTGESFNALLKTLEEPPAHVVFILATTEAHKLPATIISRVQRFHFRPVSLDKTVNHLRTIATAEGIVIDEQALKLIAEHGEGSFRDSISLLDQLASMSNNNVSVSFVETSLGLASGSEVQAIVSMIKSGERQSLHNCLINLENRGVSAQVLAQQLLRYLKHLSVNEPQFYSLIDDLLQINKSTQPYLKLLIILLTFTPASKKPPEAIKPAALRIPGKAAHVIEQPLYTITKPDPDLGNPEAMRQPTETILSEVKSGKILLSEHWPEVLQELKRSNPPLYAIVKKAEPRFDAEKLTLTLSFKLHKLKLEDNKYRSKFNECLARLGYKSPMLVIVHDSSASAPTITDHVLLKPVNVDKTAEAVLAMMGGGELVNAESL